MAQRSGTVVAGLTAAALAVVAFFAYQADAAQDRAPTKRDRPSASPSKDPSPSGPAPERTALPRHSGQGERVVYALGRKRVWLVTEDGTVQRSYPVKPSTVDPAPGRYTVTSKTKRVTGSDGVPIENVVIFTSVDGIVIGFSAAVDGSLADPDPSRRTGGIREARADGAALWRFAQVGTPVVVVR